MDLNFFTNFFEIFTKAKTTRNTVPEVVQTERFIALLGMFAVFVSPWYFGILAVILAIILFLRSIEKV